MKQKLLFILQILLIISACSPKKNSKTEDDSLFFTIHDEEELSEYTERKDADSTKCRYWLPILNYYSEKGDYQSILNDAKPLFLDSKQKNDTIALQYYGSYITQAYLFKEKFDSLMHYIDILYLYDIDKNPFLSSFFNNISAIYSIKAELNYSKAIDYLDKGYEVAVKTNDIGNQIVILSNISSVYYLREDSLGFKYAQKAVELSKFPEAPSYAKCLSNMSYSQMLLLKGEYDNALEYINIALELAKEEHNASLRSAIYLVLAKLYMKKDNFIRSEYYYNTALEHSSYSDPGTIVEILYNYANLMFENKRYSDALELYMQGLNISYKYKNVEYRSNILMAISNLYKNIGDRERSFDYYQKFHEYNDSILNIQKEREFVSKQLYQQKMRHEQELKEQELRYLQENQKMTIFFFIIILVSLLMIGTLVTYRRKLKTYSKLAQQHYVYMQRAKLCESYENREHPRALAENPVEIVDVEIDTPAPTEQTASTEENGEEAVDNNKIILMNLERVMREEKIYRNKELTLEKVAEKLSTNRTYLSHSINSIANMSFSHYINMFRINEATELLAEPDFDMPLKQLADELGFNSQSVFYRAFQREIGCSPLRYRNEILKLKSPNK